MTYQYDLGTRAAPRGAACFLDFPFREAAVEYRRRLRAEDGGVAVGVWWPVCMQHWQIISDLNAASGEAPR